MIGVLFSQNTLGTAAGSESAESHRRAGPLVLAALRRSVTHTQAEPIALAALDGQRFVVAVDVPEQWGERLAQWWKGSDATGAGRKLIVFGRVPSALLRVLGWSTTALDPSLAAASRSAPAPRFGMAQSAATVAYLPAAAVLGAPLSVRPFERFDFADEWNNLGYGAIRVDADAVAEGQRSPWALATGIDAGSDAIATVCIDDTPLCSYAALVDTPSASLVWVNRAAGCIDSFEWRWIEYFIAHHRHAHLPCRPVLREIPWGHDAVITSRLDCDEDVESARQLWWAYEALDVPFSLAVHTQNLGDPGQHGILRDLVAAGFPPLSHTATHAPNWGGSYDAALGEAQHSAAAITAITGHPVRYAVSPFHQTPDYALRALADAGYAGCIGGIIRNDPAFVLARGGELDGLPSGFVGHSQQCMLHGECMLAYGDPLAMFKRAFDQALDTATLFGYLDHPFSPRYAYGWTDEPQRIQAHRDLIAYIRSRARQPLFVDETTAMDFLLDKAAARIVTLDDADGRHARFRLATPLLPLAQRKPLPFAVDFRGAVMPVSALEGQAEDKGLQS